MFLLEPRNVNDIQKASRFNARTIALLHLKANNNKSINFCHFVDHHYSWDCAYIRSFFTLVRVVNVSVEYNS